ncbi:MAG TPA: MBL fold metallo-hydrolase [Paenibacillus sp.]|uniref:MBL fold metallo-hydrolase n=1 Tax=Paenibacillus sp. TaxID=58172 RepID=UPI002CFDCD70|nr:MBL fold metallo-hydrolase [Paenibacillus sp.]HUC93833.1 MBL fold metallo-hydrolase [Paenibacillus sp.]
MSELLILDTSAGVSTVSCHHFSMAVKKDGRLYLIDCGGPVCMLLQQMGEDPRNIDTVFLTHWHPDHVSGLTMLLQNLQLTFIRPSSTPL